MRSDGKPRSAVKRLKTRWRVVRLRGKLRRHGRQRPRVNLSAGRHRQAGWLRTRYEMFDVTEASEWERYFLDNGIRALMAEHVWEHLTVEDGHCAAALCFRYLEPGGHLRVAVPDGLHPDPQYIRMVEVNGLGPGADDHKVLYDYHSLGALFEEAGFRVRLLEFFDENGKFNFAQWEPEDGLIRRSRRGDPQATHDPLDHASLILDAIKPGTTVD